MNTLARHLIASLFVLAPFALTASAEEQAGWLRASAISPDGKTIAFSYKGDIFTVPSTGGAAQRLTSNPAYDGYPHWSPDGKRIAFSSDRYGSMDVFIVSPAGGEPKRLTTHSSGEMVQGWLDNEHVLYTSYYLNSAQDIIFPLNFLQVYSVDVEAHRPVLFSAIGMESISVNGQGEVLYHNAKGYEDNWRKHHRSPITRDILLTQAKTENRTFRQLSTDAAENREPVWKADGKGYWYLSEKNGIFNVFSVASVGGPEKQLTDFKKHPVRYLSASRDGLLCFSWDGGLYTLREGGKPQKLDIRVTMDNDERYRQPSVQTSGASGFAIAKDEKEVIFTLGGDVYATMMDYATTRRLTKTPQTEAHPTVSPDGRTIVYAGEREGTWNLYKLTLVNAEDKLFSYATDTKEELLLGGKEPTFLPKFSPDGKKLAFLANRSEIRVMDMASKKVTVAVPRDYNFSYSDGDVNFEWSPDSRWILTTSLKDGGWNNTDVIVASADGQRIENLTKSGYSDGSARWAMGGKAVVWHSDRAGYRSHGSWGAERDAYIMFLDKETWLLAQMNKEDRERTLAEKKELEEKQKAADDKAQNKAKDKKTDKKDKKDDTAAKADSAKADAVKPLQLDFADCELRVMRLTTHSSHLGWSYLTEDGKKFYYTTSYEGGLDLWLHDIENNSTRLVTKGFGHWNIRPDQKGEALYLCGGVLKKMNLADARTTDIAFQAEREGQTAEERSNLYDHCVNQVSARFCDVNYHGIDFAEYSAHYRRFLPSISNNRDLSEMVSELLGELNCSHTGLKYRPSVNAQATANVGAFLDDSYQGDGLKIKEIIKNGPLDLPDSRIQAGVVITAIDHQPIKARQDYFPLLAGKADKNVVLTLQGDKGASFDIRIKPRTVGSLKPLLYRRWVERCRQVTEEYSKGQIGYVHVEDMDSKSFRTVYSDILGRYRNCKAIIVDERHNGGGWLHDDLGILLSGQQFQTYVSRGQVLGADPYSRWNKPSCVLMCEDCYSNAHGFPAMYRALGLGKLIGTPVAGTMTAVWWEKLGDLTLGLPEVYCLDMEGKPLENKQLDPDITVYNTPEQLLGGDDAQLRRAIDHLLQTVK